MFLSGRTSRSCSPSGGSTCRCSGFPRTAPSGSPSPPCSSRLALWLRGRAGGLLRVHAVAPALSGGEADGALRAVRRGAARRGADALFIGDDLGREKCRSAQSHRLRSRSIACTAAPRARGRRRVPRRRPGGLRPVPRRRGRAERACPPGCPRRTPSRAELARRARPRLALFAGERRRVAPDDELAAEGSDEEARHGADGQDARVHWNPPTSTSPPWPLPKVGASATFWGRILGRAK